MARWFVDRSPQQGIPSVSLRRLLPEARFVGCQDWEVSGCNADSRRLDPGQVFVAVRGSDHDGHEYVGQALERGAAGVVVERPCPEAGRLQVVVPDSRLALARLCHALAGDPTRQLLTLGVSGTCGGALTGLYLRSIFEATGVRFGLIGSLGWSDGVVTRPLGMPAPGPEGLATMLAAMVERGCQGSVIELSADSLRRRRGDGLELDAAVVTDLGVSPGQGAEAIQARRRAKARLFRMVEAGGATVINADDPLADVLGAVNLEARRVSYGIDRPADVAARIERSDASGIRFKLLGFDREASVDLRGPGAPCVSHALAAAAVAWSRGVAIDAVVAGLEAVANVPGRLEAVHEARDFAVWVDQARTGAELWEALRSIRGLCTGQVHCVIGAEGLRDRRERRDLADAAEAGSDRLILTGDNPRTEDPNQILDDLLAGLQRPGRVLIEPDRRRAIEAALSDARPGDAVLIAGKGPRAYQILADHVVPFDDRVVAAAYLRGLRPSRRRASA